MIEWFGPNVCLVDNGIPFRDVAIARCERKMLDEILYGTDEPPYNFPIRGRSVVLSLVENWSKANPLGE